MKTLLHPHSGNCDDAPTALAAPYHRRAAAFVVDVACAALPLWLTAPVFLMYSSGSSESVFTGHIVFEVNLLFSAVLLIIGQLITAVLRRPTPGRRLLGLEIVAVDGQEPSWVRMLGRLALPYLLTGICLLLGILPAALALFAYALADRHGRGFADRLVGTTVAAVTRDATERPSV